jgi:hypothetical protein
MVQCGLKAWPIQILLGQHKPHSHGLYVVHAETAGRNCQLHSIIILIIQRYFRHKERPYEQKAASIVMHVIGTIVEDAAASNIVA